MKVGGISGNLKLAFDSRSLGVFQVKHKEWIGLPKGNDISAITDKTHGENPFIFSKIFHGSLHLHSAVEYIYITGGLGNLTADNPEPASADGSRNTKIALILIKGELIDRLAGNTAGSTNRKIFDVDFHNASRLKFPAMRVC